MSILEKIKKNWTGWGEATHTPNNLAAELERERDLRLYLTWRVLNRTFNDHLIKPNTLSESIWEPIKKTFTVTDLARPVLTMINSATYGGKVYREIKKARNLEAVKQFMKEARYDAYMPSFHRYAAAYGTAYTLLGRNKGRATLVSLPSISTRIDSPINDVMDVEQIRVNYGDSIRVFRADGIYNLDKSHGGLWGWISKSEPVKEKNSDYGFIPVTIGRGSWMDASTPYGESLIWPAVEETKQVTYLMCHLMVLEKAQSFSTLVIIGSPVAGKDGETLGPFTFLRFDGDKDSKCDAKYISPEASIKEINDIIDSKLARCATQCQVPVEVFTGFKSGANQGTGAAMLTHKQLFDLVIAQQQAWIETELDLVARIDAFIEFENTGERQDINEFKAELEMTIKFENESNPARTQSETQAWAMMVEEDFVTHEEAIKHFNKDEATDELIKHLKARREKKEQALTDDILMQNQAG